MIRNEKALGQWLDAYVEENRSRLVQMVRDLVRIPSENSPPRGAEEDCQRYLADQLSRNGWAPELYSLDEVPGLKDHPLFWSGREYQHRPNLGARMTGQGRGRSLILSGHIDTVPRGSQPWSKDPFGGQVEGNRLYGRGSNDMKGGVATNLFVVEALQRLKLKLRGDLIFESVVDEEFGGVNGTLAGRLKGFNADAAIISEPSFLRICPAQRGGRIAHLYLAAPGGVLTEGQFPKGVIEQLTYFLKRVQDFAQQRRSRALTHEFYAQHSDPVPVSITKVITGPWGTSEPITIPESCRIEMYWQLMPGERQSSVDEEFSEWLQAVTAERPDLFPQAPEVQFPVRWLPGSAIARSEPLVKELSACAAEVLGHIPPIAGIEGPCDMYVFHQEFGIPAVLWGARGGNTHAADEYLEIDSAVSAARTLLRFVCNWCGVAD
ncbi:MAG: M20/M25/M40 family metallo-hydrolase [Acidobacteriota bacterium]